MTVIRLVNDAVDNIESEGMKEYHLTPLSLLCLPPDAKGFVQWCKTIIYGCECSQAAAVQYTFHSE